MMRVSSTIRGNQIAERLGAKLNPKSGYQNDVCVYVKPSLGTVFEGNPYIDVVDEEGPLVNNLNIPAIACSEFSYKVLSKFKSKKLVLIPQQHCNFDRLKRERKDITVVGVIGQPEAFPRIPAEIGDILSTKGIMFLQYSKFITREDVVNFYKNIDIQLIWRPYRIKLGNPLKLVNSMSFGVPTIALPDNGLIEMEGYYLPANNPNEFATQLDNLISNPNLYNDYSSKGMVKSEEYHIDNICKLYQQL
jgi:glycosyltransferase involved in cell wall biosynthesis